MAKQPNNRTTQVTDYRQNLNPGASCRRNWNEANIWSITDHRATLYFNPVPAATCIHWTSFGDGNDIVAGYTVAGDVLAESGSYIFDYKIRQGDFDAYGTLALEIIGWRTGFFVGDPLYNYAESWVGNRVEERVRTVTLNSSHPYITWVVSAVSLGGGSRPYMYFDRMRAYKT